MATFKFSSMIDVNSEFDCAMIKVFMAREDLYKSMKLMEENADDGHMLYFPFKVQIGYIKEVKTFFYNVLFKRHMRELKQFENYEIIFQLKEKFDELAKKYCVFLKNIRNFSFHYSEKDDLGNLFSSSGFKDFDAEIVIGDKECDVHYYFTDEIYIQMLCKYFYNEEFASDIEQIKVNNMMKEIGDFGVLIIKLLQEIIAGFLETKADQLEIIAE